MERRAALCVCGDHCFVATSRWGVTMTSPEDGGWLEDRPWFLQAGKWAPYAASTKGGKKTYLHRVLMPGAPYVDHINRNGLDNRRCNLRRATASQNGANATGQRGTSSKYRGVSFYRSRGKWTAQVAKDGRVHHLGYFSSEDAAASAFNEMAIELYGDYARLNVIGGGDGAEMAA